MKQCNKCKEFKSFTEFNKHVLHKDGLRTRCKLCEAVDAKERKVKELQENYLDTRLKERAANLKRRFGLSLEDYKKKAKEQNSVCAICQLPCKSGKNLAVDHDHKTGKIRDLLCGNCNGGLGKFQDNPELLIKAADYLRKHHDNT